MTISIVVPVSIIIPCCRCAASIYRAIDFIVKQIQKPAEVILVDDASSNNTLEIMHKIADQYSVWVKVIGLINNQEAVNARNAGLDADEWCMQYLDVASGLLLK